MKTLADVKSVSKVRLFVVTLVLSLNVLSFSHDTGQYIENEDSMVAIAQKGPDMTKVSFVEKESLITSDLELRTEFGSVQTQLLNSHDEDEYVVIVGMFTGEIYLNNEFMSYSQGALVFFLIVDFDGNVSRFEVIEDDLIPLAIKKDKVNNFYLEAVRFNREEMKHTVRVASDELINFPLVQDSFKYDQVSAPESPENDDPDGISFGYVEPTDFAANTGSYPGLPENDDPDGKQSKPFQTFNLVQIPGVGQVLIIR